MGFQEEIVLSGLEAPIAVEFSPDGRIFVAEKSGLIKVFDSLTDTSPTIFADLRTNVYNFWDRGLMDIALPPDFPNTPYVYALYALDAEIGGTPPRWGAPGATADPCPTPPGPVADGCVTGGRLSRLPAAGDVQSGPEEILIEDFCTQFPSHSVGSVFFGPDGALYLSAGDGGSFTELDWGQLGDPVNPCGDSPGGVGGPMPLPTAEGGTLRAQDLRTPGDPVSLDGTVMRVDPNTGAALPDNPLFGGSVADDDRIIAYGLRQPFRMTLRPGTSEIWVGDVGWGAWEELNRIASPTDGIVENFGWPCYEGGGRVPSYDAVDLNICEDLYAESGAVTGPHYAYLHDGVVVPDGVCGAGSSSVTGLAFYEGGAYPPAYDGALFFGDFSRECIWVMFAGPDGTPNPATIETFVAFAATPVEIEIGPNGDLFYVDLIDGTIRRIRHFSANQPPVAALAATPTDGPTPLTVNFDGSGSSDPDPGDAITFDWELDGDGFFDDSSAIAPSFTYTAPGAVTVGLRVTDSAGATSTAIVIITAGNGAPTASIDAPLLSNQWDVGDTIDFSGSAIDPEDGPLPPSALSWDVILHHCFTLSDCHQHPLTGHAGVASGTVVGPDHEYPAFLELRLTATDSGGLTNTQSVELQPNTVDLSFDSIPIGLSLVVGSSSETTPFVETVMVGAANTVSAPSPQTLGDTMYGFIEWSDGGARTHTIVAPGTAVGFVATFGLDAAACGPPDGACDLTQDGIIIAQVPTPTGGGNPDLAVIRDGDKPPVGTADATRQYDTHDGANAAAEDWIGYAYPSPRTFTRVVFQEGMHFPNGGWFDSLTAQVRQGDVWVEVSGLSVSPAYPAIDNGLAFETYTLSFAPIPGDAIRLFGAPGGSGDFISVGELEVFGNADGTIPNQAPTADAGVDRTVAVGAAVLLDGSRSSDPDGGTLTYTWTQSAGAAVTLSDTTVAQPSFVAPEVTADTVFTFELVVSDGELSSPVNAVSITVSPTLGGDLTQLGAVIARVTAPLSGGGSPDIEIIRDGDKPPTSPTATADPTRQYDTYDGFNAAAEDWIGYSFASSQTFTRVVFQEGTHFWDGGWFDSLTVQVRQGGVWVEASGLTVDPAYPAADNGLAFETYMLSFAPIEGDAIRLFGAPGGLSEFISVAELEVFGVGDGTTPANEPPIADAEDAQTALPAALVTLDGSGSSDPDGDLLTYAWTQTAGPVVTLSDPSGVQPSFTAPTVTVDTVFTFELVVGDGEFASAPDAVSITVASGDESDLTQLGAVIARVTAPTGAGNPDIEVIRDGDMPPDGDFPLRQYDTFDGFDPVTEDWIGYSFGSSHLFTRIVFQEGKNFFDGGWFESLTVQIRQGGVWAEVTGLSITPAYPAADNDIDFEIFTLTFDPISGDGIRIIGAPGGPADFISVGELLVFGY